MAVSYTHLLVREALHRTHREDLIGYGKGCLLRPNGPARPGDQPSGRGKPAPAKGKAQPLSLIHI